MMQEETAVQIAADPAAERFQHARFIAPERIAEDTVRGQIARLRELFYERLPTGDQTVQIEEYINALGQKLLRDERDNKKSVLEVGGRQQLEHIGT